MKKYLIVLLVLVFSNCKRDNCDEVQEVDNVFRNTYSSIDENISTRIPVHSDSGANFNLTLIKETFDDDIFAGKKRCFTQTSVNLKFKNNVYDINFEIYLGLALEKNKIDYIQKLEKGEIKALLFSFDIDSKKMKTSSSNIADKFISKNVSLIQLDTLTTHFGKFTDIYCFSINDIPKSNNKRLIQKIYIHKGYGVLRYVNIDGVEWDLEVIY